MGEPKNEHWLQFSCFQTKITIGEDLLQETWIPMLKGLQTRGINFIILSQKVNAKNDNSDFVLIAKTSWDALQAIQRAFPDGLNAPSLTATKGAISTTHVGFFRVKSTKKSDETGEDRHDKLMENELKVIMMTKKSLSENEISSKVESLHLLKGLQSYCIYELEHSAFSDSQNNFCTWIIEVFIQTFFKDIVLDEIESLGQFKDWELLVHQDLVKLRM